MIHHIGFKEKRNFFRRKSPKIEIITLAPWIQSFFSRQKLSVQNRRQTGSYGSVGRSWFSLTGGLDNWVSQPHEPWLETESGKGLFTQTLVAPCRTMPRDTNI
jgi:hypothetical protein